MAHTRVYCKGVLEAEDFPVAEVSDHLERPDTVIWVDLCGPSRDQLHELADELGLHPLAVEDALEPHQRPKLDHYSSHSFLSCHSVRVDAEAGRLEETEVDAFISDALAHHRPPGRQVRHRPSGAALGPLPDLLVQGVGFLLYGLLDVIVDGYFDAVQCFDEYYDQVSEGIFAETPLQPSEQRHWFQMRQALVRFHRLVVPMREAVSGLMRREHHSVSEDLYPYYQDVYDHVLRVSESTDALRDLVSTIVETNLSVRDYRTNQIMKKVTSWAAIIAVPTLITGYYGMNVPYPTSGQTSGVIVSLALMIAMAGALYLIFKRKEWL